VKIPRTRTFAVLGAAAAASAAVALSCPAVAAAGPSWVGTWTGSPIAGASSSSCPAGDGAMAGRTVRNIVYPSVSGSRVRVRFSNTFGTAPLTIGSASVAVAETGAQTVPGTMRRLLFGGKRSVTVPAGAEALSDWLDMNVAQQRDLAVSAYVPALTGPATFHSLAMQKSFTGPGDAATKAAAANFPTAISCWLFADGVDVLPSSRVRGSVVAFGDSITDGYGSAVNANDRWPNFLARRLDARAGNTLSVVDEGISGNRVLSDAGTAGVSALARFDRDVLSQPGARDVIVVEGINDIGNSDIGAIPTVTAPDLIAGYRQMISQAHAAGLRIFGGTLTPFQGAGYWSAQGEQTRDAANRWIRSSGEFDGVVDFAAATASPDNPKVFDPAYDSGDHLHPNDSGYRAMADAISLSALMR
jgi:lysophospholipase L1-like esterase